MKRIFSVILALVLVLSLAACSTHEETEQDNILTIPFEFGERTGSYAGDVDEDGLPHGYGTFTSQRPDGTGWTYTGEWDHGHWNGQGITKWSMGESHCGYYTADEMTGYGTYSIQDGSVIVGNFVNGVPTGYCAVYLHGSYDGYVFWGYYINGEADGIVYMPDGSTVEATHKNGSINFNIGDIANPSEAESMQSDLNPHATEETVPETEPEVETSTQETEDTPQKLEVTNGMRNALKSAKNYLSIMPFSYSGLIGQLEYDQYTHEEAVYAADNCGADWNEQAAKKAKSYLELMSFSRGRLIDQLEYDGFTNEQAVYGVEQNGL